MEQVLLTGICPTGSLHLGNFVGAIKPFLNFANKTSYQPIVFIADYHSFARSIHPSARLISIKEIACFYCSLEIPNLIIFRQSDVPEITQFMWLLMSICSENQLRRCHAYKNANNAINSAALINYPILMAADILSLQANLVAVGSDQKQHLEMTRKLANTFNERYGAIFTVPKYSAFTDTIKGTDGRKMSKSYHNVIPLLGDTRFLQKTIFSIKTTSQPECAPKDYNTCTIFNILSHIVDNSELEEIKKWYLQGISWLKIKNLLYQKIEEIIFPYRARYNHFLANYEDIVVKKLSYNAEIVGAKTRSLLENTKRLVGL